MHIVSNNPSQKRISLIGSYLGLPFTYLAGKPRISSTMKVVNSMKINKAEIAIIGDRIFTDILVGNRIGLYTVLVKPLGKDGKTKTKNRLQSIEKRLAKVFGA